MESARSRTEACLARIAARDGEIGAWAYVDPDAALAQADRLDATTERGPLHGLPIGIKDVLTTHDMPTRYNCDLYRDHFPKVDAACVKLLRQAGAVILGKTATVELASIGAPPRTRNPHSLAHTPGGSSSGSAAAVADGQVPMAIGTQTGGSIIRPASYCGVWALKPTWGSVCTEGAKRFAPSLDTIGWFGRDVSDLKLLFDALVPESEPPEPLKRRIGVWRTGGWDRAGPAAREALDMAVAQLRKNGFEVKDVTPPLDDLADVQLAIMRGEGRRSFLPEVKADASRIHPRIVDMVREEPSDLRPAYDRAAEARPLFDDMTANYDAILSLSTTGEAPLGLEFTGDLIFNGVFTLLHVPCLNLPLWKGSSGLPVGLTLSAARGRDRHLMNVAHCVGEMAKA